MEENQVIKKLKIENVDFWGGHNYNKGGMRIYWSADIGFGTVDIVKVKGIDGDDLESPFEKLKIVAHSEAMDTDSNKSFTAELLRLLLKKLKVID
jgi:hypothetical protein